MVFQSKDEFYLLFYINKQYHRIHILPEVLIVFKALMHDRCHSSSTLSFLRKQESSYIGVYTFKRSSNA